ncbi:proline--tRNA ligase [Asanoa iriomotensis]|uniref:Proline--tRNA ligase n=2 Tax=Asanoa iriomotensis TaxID=234613 RepID=A0ABQ4C096_9ACTN|nr:proline--tRNA ligase [Asanoa iriomotensis]
MSTLFLRTLREDPADAEVASHRLLLRAGYVRRAAPGGFTWLPLGKLLVDRVTDLVRAELAAVGAQEVQFPALLPREPYEKSGRWTEYGDGIFRLTDRRGAEFLLAPTHEEMFALLVRDLFSSYRDYPVLLYQVQTKFRDEARPRGGLLRGREFLMKDAYSFDLDDAGLSASYATMRAAYQRIFDGLGLRYAVVKASSGLMGGSASEEFLATTSVGEDTFVACAACGYAANTEAVVTPPGAVSDPGQRPAASTHDTPDTPTIESLVALANARRLGGRSDWTARDTLKNVVVTVTPPGGKGAPLVIGVPGDREVDLKRLAAAVEPATVELFDDWAAYPSLVRGYIGPQVLAGLGIRYLVDPRVAVGTAWLTGANSPGQHAVDVTHGRDFVADGTIEAASVHVGDPCPVCSSGSLSMRRGIEIGHIFQLGRRFTDAFGVDALGPSGKPVRPVMGCYGIGISRAVAAIAEQHHDERGLVWPASVAPVDVHVVAAGKALASGALALGASLEARGLRVLVDDRPVSPGVKFTDAELIGIPAVVVVGRRFGEGVVELRDRAAGSRVEMSVSEVADAIATRAAVSGVPSA